MFLCTFEYVLHILYINTSVTARIALKGVARKRRADPLLFVAVNKTGNKMINVFIDCVNVMEVLKLMNLNY